VPEPMPEVALQMLRAKLALNQDHFKVKISKAALRAAVDMSVRYLIDRRLPDKAQDVLEEAASRVANRRRPGQIVTVADIQEVVQEWSGVPIRNKAQEAQKVLNLDKSLAGHVFGQDDAVGQTARAVRRARAQMMRTGAKRPVSMVYLGPTGVGKTELGKALARELFDDESAATVVDMSEFQEKHTISRLVGSPNGYVDSDKGGSLTNAVRQRPFQVIILDEIEKAHPDLWNSFMAMLEEGRLTDIEGAVDFRNTIVIMTSNAVTGMPKAKAKIGFARGGEEGEAEPSDKALRDLLVAKGFRPELVNRVDGVALFKPLSEPTLKMVVGKTLREVGKQYGVTVKPTDAARAQLLKDGNDPMYGARPLRRAAQAVEDEIAQKVLAGDASRDYAIDYKNGKYVVVGEKSAAATGAASIHSINPKLRKRLAQFKAANKGKALVNQSGAKKHGDTRVIKSRTAARGR